MKTHAEGRYRGDGEIWANGTNIPSPLFIYSKKLPLLSIRASGQWAGTHVFEVLHGKQYIRKLSAVEKQKHGWLEDHWALTKRGVAAWKSLDGDIKRRLDARASKLGLRMSGFNFFMRLWFKNKPALKIYYPAGRD